MDKFMQLSRSNQLSKTRTLHQKRVTAEHPKPRKRRPISSNGSDDGFQRRLLKTSMAKSPLLQAQSTSHTWKQLGGINSIFTSDKPDNNSNRMMNRIESQANSLMSEFNSLVSDNSFKKHINQIIEKSI